MSKRLSREDFIRHQRQKLQGEQGRFDELDMKALEGLQYLDENQDAEEVLTRLDGRFRDQIVKTTRLPGSRIISLHRFVRAAAIALLIIIPSFLLLRPTSNARLFTAYFDIAPNTYYQISRSGQGGALMEISQAFAAYEMKHYSKAGDQLDDLIRKYPEKQDLVLYRAVTYLAQNQSTPAIPLLQKSLQITYRDVNQRASWYLALAYLKESNTEAASEQLMSIIDNDWSMKSEAEKLLKELN
ncbi:MAG: hypothetical protein OEQ53_05525 [Saprospiraceae bacterium]|nr:hypothetical protein [Saprospiraceae bacterium]